VDRGVYIERVDAPDALGLRHAVRITHYLYPRAYLSSASSVLLVPMRDSRLFLVDAATISRISDAR
jgi:serine/threonine-protein kinase HipA